MATQTLTVQSPVSSAYSLLPPSAISGDKLTVDSLTQAGATVTVSSRGLAKFDYSQVSGGIPFQDSFSSSYYDSYSQKQYPSQTYTVKNITLQTQVTSVDVPTSGSYYTGSTLSFTVHVSNVVTVTGNPEIPVYFNSGLTNFTYASGSGTQTLVFSKTLTAQDLNTEGYIVGDSIKLNGGSLKNAAGNNLDLSLRNFGSSILSVNGPTLVSSVSGPSAGVYGLGSTLSFTVTFGGVLTLNSGTPALALDVGTRTGVPAPYVSGSGTNAWTFSYTVQAMDLDLDGISLEPRFNTSGCSITDSHGNGVDNLLAGLPDLTGVVVNAATPVISSVSSLVQENTATITGSLFGSQTGEVFLENATASVMVKQTISSWSAGSINFNVNQGNLPFGSTTYVRVVGTNGQNSVYGPVSLSPPTGRGFVVVASPASSGSLLDGVNSGDVVDFYSQAEGTSETVTVNTDGTFSTSDSKFARVVQYRVWNAGQGYWSGFRHATEVGKPRNDTKGGDSSGLSGANPSVRNISVGIKI